MPELGKYAYEVMSAYAASLVLLSVLVLWTLGSSKRARETLAQAEKEAGRDG